MEQQPPAQPGARDHFLPVSILVAAILISGALIYTTGAKNGGRAGGAAENAGSDNGNAPAASAAVSEIRERDVILGDPNAKVTIVEYGDYQCPYCANFYKETEPLLRDTYVKTGKVKMVYRDFAFLGPESVEAAEAAECAKNQGKFWAFHDALFDAEAADGAEHNGNLNKTLFVKIAGDVGMDAGAFTECYDGNTYAEEVTTSRVAAGEAGVTGTPATFVNGRFVEGAQPFSVFKSAIDDALGS